jgi:hypothetical protein
MGKKSNVDKMPEAFRNELIALLNNPAVTQAEIVELINERAGEKIISRSGVNRYKIRMDKFTKKNLQAREVADAYIAKYGGTERNKIGQVVNEQIRLAIFDLISEVEEIKEGGTLDEIKKSKFTKQLAKLFREAENWKN